MGSGPGEEDSGSREGERQAAAAAERGQGEVEEGRIGFARRKPQADLVREVVTRRSSVPFPSYVTEGIFYSRLSTVARVKYIRVIVATIVISRRFVLTALVAS